MRLPESLEETNQLRRMRIGESGWTVPWAMTVDGRRSLWLHAEYTYDSEPLEAAQMYVARIDGGFLVDVSRCKDHRWTPRSSEWGNDLPVIELRGIDSPLDGSQADVKAVEVALAAPPPAAPEPSPPPRHGLTKRQREVVMLLVRGRTTLEIAEKLVIAEGTALSHVAHIRAKLGLKSRGQVVAWAIEHGLVPDDLRSRPKK